MPVQVGSILKLAISEQEINYFEVKNLDISAVRLKHLCKIQDGQISVQEKKPDFFIFNGEIGRNYHQVVNPEVAELRKLILREIYRMFVLLKYFV